MCYMMCENCNQNPANVHLTQITDEETVVVHLCEECAREKGIHVSLAQTEQHELPPVSPQKESLCPSCRMKLSDFRKHGRIGCSACYAAFEKEIDELLLQVHGSCTHKGKIYAHTVAGNVATEDVTRLRHELDNAIRCEKFELAATIRDKISRLSRKLLHSAAVPPKAESADFP